MAKRQKMISTEINDSSIGKRDYLPDVEVLNTAKNTLQLQEKRGTLISCY